LSSEAKPNLKRPLPSGRTYDQLLNHYQVEKNLARRLKQSRREERSEILSTMYDELFREVPDHPRLTRRKDRHKSELTSVEKMALVRVFLGGASNFLEFAPGDCKFAMGLTEQVDTVYGVDVSDQREPHTVTPGNFKLILYDGYSIDRIEPGSIDVAFSDQLIEHIHPEDTALHFELAARLLRKGGMYVFRTPHAQTGPHDVSKYFSDHAEGFHLKEWTYTEIVGVIRRAGFSSVKCYRFAKRRTLRLPYFYFASLEWLFDHLPPHFVRRPANLLISSLYATAIK
jgi:SAM-dependent methyltransferase